MQGFRTRHALTTLLVLLVSSLLPGLAAQNRLVGMPPLQLFDARQTNASNMGVCTTQGSDGTMYFSGGEAILSFDGEAWTRHPTQIASLAQVLATDAQGNLWVAGSNVVGCFQRNGSILSTFHSLKELLPERLRRKCIFWYLFPREKDVIFVEESAILRWDGTRFEEWTMPGKVRLTAMRNEEGIFIHHRESGIWRFGDTRPELALAGEKLGRNSTLWMEHRGTAWLLVTGNGLRLVDESGVRLPCPEADEFIRRNFLATACHPKGGPLLIATVSGGLVSVSDDWQLSHVLNSTLGAPTNAVYSLFTDRRGDLWVGFDEGVIRMSQPRVSSLLGTGEGLGRRSANDLQVRDGLLTVATQDALFTLDARESMPRFRPLEGSGNFYLRLLSRDGYNLALGFSSLSRIAPDQPGPIIKAIAKMEDATLSRIVHGRVYYVDGDGLFSVHLDSANAQPRRIATMHDTVSELREDGEGGLWASGGAAGLTHVPPAPGSKGAFAESVVLLENRRARLGLSGGQLIIVTNEGGLRYDTGKHELVPIAALPRLQAIACSTTGEHGDAWIAYESPFPSDTRVPVVGRLHLEADGSSRWTPYTIEGLGEINGIRSLCEDDEGILWIGGGKGILRFDASRAPATTLPPAAPLLRSNIAEGAELPAQGGPVAVHLATAEYGHRETLRFQTWLSGADQHWSEPGNNPDLTFTSLRDGRYTLRARIISDKGLVSPEVTLGFVVRPPWWRGTMALGCWALLLLGAAFALPWGYSRYLRGQNRRLDELVRRRTLELERSATARLEFVRALSHELRNPIAGASIMSELILGGVREGRLAEQASNLRDCINYLETLLDGALDLTQAETGRTALRLEPFTPSMLLDDASSIFGPLSARQGLHFTHDAGPEPSQLLLGDLVQTKRILVNYLSNAFKFTARGSIHVRARLSPPEGGVRRLRLEVEDTGRGISAQMQSRLFREFIREGSRAESGAKPGAGLGLALCRRLATLAGGSVGFTSEEGRGSVFWAELPFIMTDQVPAGREPGPLPAADFSDLDVCLVDDDSLHLEALYASLEQFGIVAVKVNSAEEADLILRAKEFDVVIFDYNLGEGTGLELHARLKSTQALRPHTRCHLLTGLLDEDLSREAAEAGFDGAHRKPLSSVALFRILESIRSTRGPSKEA